MNILARFLGVLRGFGAKVVQKWSRSVVQEWSFLVILGHSRASRVFLGFPTPRVHQLSAIGSGRFWTKVTKEAIFWTRVTKVTFWSDSSKGDKSDKVVILSAFAQQK